MNSQDEELARLARMLQEQNARPVSMPYQPPIPIITNPYMGQQNQQNSSSSPSSGLSDLLDQFTGGSGGGGSGVPGGFDPQGNPALAGSDGIPLGLDAQGNAALPEAGASGGGGILGSLGLGGGTAGGGASGAMGSLGGIGAIAALIGSGKNTEYNHAGTPVGDVLLGGLAPSGAQILKDPIGMGLPTLLGAPFLTPFTASMDAKKTKPEWSGLFGLGF